VIEESEDFGSVLEQRLAKLHELADAASFRLGDALAKDVLAAAPGWLVPDAPDLLLEVGEEALLRARSARAPP